ncbi:MAG: hypothetical protein CL799_12570 [Chromatiales bacterium]|jgi:hypothetical protein|nr:hypothetical protein [Chromatiales bacterium]MDP6151623.1 DUF2845 domain-containing protein [Gammaproteobacteria bacterium]MDP7270284.1 DUF2845 domain-containing protein [Gammaproteobacteria bacterium]HJP05220.1 DUF2845 domain-containing protein [Gammaproteobacteria bacterium]
MRVPVAKSKIVISIVAATAMLLPASVLAMRCGTVLISKGDVQAKVLRYCGEPVQTNERYALRTGFYSGIGLAYNGPSGQSIKAKRYYPYGRYEVLVEGWIFNLGPNKLMRQVTFENGIVADVKTLGYGYHE